MVDFFTTPEDLRGKVLLALGNHREQIEARIAGGPAAPEAEEGKGQGASTIPSPPEMYSAPAYVPGYEFVGRRAELEELDRWAASDSALMVVEAIGGMGKSALTWQWTTTRAREVVPELAGVFWFSFYERGARLASCFQHALAYLTGQPLKEFRGRKAAELAEEVLAELQRKPYLLVFDGLERVLVAYHRLDASQIRDDQVERDLRGCIDPADTEVLRRLVACAPSRVLVSSRLFPRALENKAHRRLPGVAHKELRGLDEDDAAAFMNHAGVFGEQDTLLHFTAQFEHHPLVLGVVAGLINDYPRDPGNFDRWHSDPEAGGDLKLAELDLVQRRTHILHQALAGLDPKVRQVLCRAAAFPSAVEYETLAVISPFDSTAAFDRGLKELEQRGLLQFERAKRAYDLHPVVRGYALGLLGGKDRLRTFSTIADHFQSRPLDHYEEAKDLADLENSLAIFRALVGAGKLDEAMSFYRESFSNALLFSCEAYSTVIELLTPFFPQGLEEPAALGTARDQSYAAAALALALSESGRSQEAFKLRARNLRLALEERNAPRFSTSLANYTIGLRRQNRLAVAERGFLLGLRLAETLGGSDLTSAHHDLMNSAIRAGRWEEAERFAEVFRQGATPHRIDLRAGSFEYLLCQMHLARGRLKEVELKEALRIATEVNSREIIRLLHALRGEWELERGRPREAAEAFGETLVMAQKSGAPVGGLKAGLALAHARLGETRAATDLLTECDEDTKDWCLADAWLALGEREKAREHGLLGYEWAWADGPPHVNWRPLQRMKKLLDELGVEHPDLPPFDPATVEPLPHEEEIVAFIEELEAEQREQEEQG